MPEWKEASRDSYGFPLTKNGAMTNEERLQYLLEEVLSLHQRVKSLENTLEKLLRKKD